MSARALVAAAAVVLSAALGGCASTRPGATLGVSANSDAPYQLCALDTLRWSHAFVPRASAEQCVTILESLPIGI